MRPANGAPVLTDKALGKPVAVTLITGDTVTVAGDTRVTVAAGKGRDKVHFMTFRRKGGLQVVPADALPLMSKLDPRLFDVSTLIKFGYDDAHTASVPLIVMGARPGTRTMAGATRVRALPGGTAMRVGKATAAATWSDLSRSLAGTRAASGTRKVWLDGRRQVDLKESVPQIGAPAAWAAGYNGTGVKVGLVDTGVDSTHPDLAGRIAAEQDFTGEGLADAAGHGTHVAATIASTGAAAGG
ncbi:MAG: hypothetical protein JWO79_2590 [Actinomycetia bacterium]|nr:hypothetical protein [Actinomycetes bacterium]